MNAAIKSPFFISAFPFLILNPSSLNPIFSILFPFDKIFGTNKKMPMPSIVWSYFDEFEGGGKCRLCGCIRNRKDKSTSTFWQHLERVHGLDKRQMLLNSTTHTNLASGKMKIDSNNTGSTAKRSSASMDTVGDNKDDNASPIDKMPKLELMADLDQQATEETFKFISELVKQQHRPSLPLPMPNETLQQQTDAGDHQTQEDLREESCEDEIEKDKQFNGISSAIGISFNGLTNGAEIITNFDGIVEQLPLDNANTNKKIKLLSPPAPTEFIRTSSLQSNNSSSSSIFPNTTSSSPSIHQNNKCFGVANKAKSQSPAAAVEITPAKKREDFLSWDEFFMSTAILAAQRSKDPNGQVGAAIVKENTIIGIGYNGMPSGCPDDEMPWGKSDRDPLNTKHYYVCHAEMNAILNKNCADVRDATIYTTLFPCCECAKLIIQSGIKRVVYLKDREALEMAASRRLFDITGTKYSQFESNRGEIVIKFSC